MTRTPVVLIVLAIQAVIGTNVTFADEQPNANLRIVVVAGEDAVNIIQQKTAVAPLIEVRDRNNLPVSGAVVTFTVAGGKGAAFGGASTLTVTTNAAGQAAAAGFSPVAAGAVQINVQAAFQGQVAAATIAQTNVMTAAEAAAAAATGGGGAGSGSAGAGGTGGGGGLSGAAIGGIAAGVAGAGALIATSGGDDPPPNNAPITGNISATPSTVLLSADPVLFNAQASDADNDPLTYRWEFGDGNTSAEAAPRYTYTSAGTFTVRLSVSDGKATTTSQTTVNVRSLSATWTSGSFTSNFGPIVMIMTLSQSGATLSGAVPVIAGPSGSGGPGTLQGSVQAASPRISLTLTFNNDGTPGRTNIYQLALDPGEDVSVLTGTIFGSTPITFRRQ